MLQNQMTLNIISEIKERERRTEDKSEIQKSCQKWRKTIRPLKWLSLVILAITPIFQVPNWCIRDGLFEPGFRTH